MKKGAETKKAIKELNFGSTKYKNKKITVNGVRFDSIKEANRYCDLLIMQRAGEISGLKLQVPFTLLDSYVREDGKKIRGITYIADFIYYDKDGKLHVEDVKGYKNEVYKLKKKIFEKLYGVLEEV